MKAELSHVLVYHIVGTRLVYILDNAMERAVQLLHIQTCASAVCVLWSQCSSTSSRELRVSELIAHLCRWLDCQHGEVHPNSSNSSRGTQMRAPTFDLGAPPIFVGPTFMLPLQQHPPYLGPQFQPNDTGKWDLLVFFSSSLLYPVHMWPHLFFSVASPLGSREGARR